MEFSRVLAQQVCGADEPGLQHAHDEGSRACERSSTCTPSSVSDCAELFAEDVSTLRTMKSTISIGV